MWNKETAHVTNDAFDLERENRLLSEALSRETHLRERAEKACQELQKRLQRLSESEKALKTKLDRVSHENKIEDKLEVIRLDHLVAQLSAQIETQENLLRDTENREAEYEKITLDNMDKLQAQWIKVLSANHARQKESQARIEELEARLRRFEAHADIPTTEPSAISCAQLAQARAECAKLEEELRRAQQAADSWRAKHDKAEAERRDAERRAGAGHEAQEVPAPFRAPAAVPAALRAARLRVARAPAARKPVGAQTRPQRSHCSRLLQPLGPSARSSGRAARERLLACWLAGWLACLQAGWLACLLAHASSLVGASSRARERLWMCRPPRARPCTTMNTGTRARARACSRHMRSGCVRHQCTVRHGACVSVVGPPGARGAGAALHAGGAAGRRADRLPPRLPRRARRRWRRQTAASAPGPRRAGVGGGAAGCGGAAGGCRASTPPPPPPHPNPSTASPSFCLLPIIPQAPTPASNTSPPHSRRTRSRTGTQGKGRADGRRVRRTGSRRCRAGPRARTPPPTRHGATGAPRRAPRAAPSRPR